MTCFIMCVPPGYGRTASNRSTQCNDGANGLLPSVMRSTGVSDFASLPKPLELCTHPLSHRRNTPVTPTIDRYNPKSVKSNRCLNIASCRLDLRAALPKKSPVARRTDWYGGLSPQTCVSITQTAAGTTPSNAHPNGRTHACDPSHPPVSTFKPSPTASPESRSLPNPCHSPAHLIPHSNIPAHPSPCTISKPHLPTRTIPYSYPHLTMRSAARNKAEPHPTPTTCTSGIQTAKGQTRTDLNAHLAYANPSSGCPSKHARSSILPAAAHAAHAQSADRRCCSPCSDRQT